MIAQIFQACTNALRWLACATGLTYEQVNVWLFCIIGPLVFVVLVWLLLWARCCLQCYRDLYWSDPDTELVGWQHCFVTQPHAEHEVLVEKVTPDDGPLGVGDHLFMVRDGIGRVSVFTGEELDSLCAEWTVWKQKENQRGNQGT